jgi:hypothetical protein
MLNPSDFQIVNVDVDVYIRSTMHILEGIGRQKSSSYASISWTVVFGRILKLIGYLD